MKQGTFEENIFIHCDVASAMNLLTNFTEYHNFHPLIEKVEIAKHTP